MTTPPNPREALRADLQRSVEFSWNFANAKPDIGENEKMHVLGLCRMLNLAIEALAAQPPAVSVDWRDGFPPLTKLDDKPCKGPDGRPIPPMRESDEVIVCTDDGRVVMDHCCAIGDGMPLWFLNAGRVIGWMPKPAALNPEAHDGRE